MNLRFFAWLAAVLALIAAVVLLGLVLVLRAVLAPQPGEWTVPLGIGPLRLEVGVPSLIRLASAPWAAPLLNGRSVRSAAGRLRLRWDSSGQRWTVLCAPCRLHLPALGAEPLLLASLSLQGRRQGDQMAGRWQAGPLQGSWRGQLAPRGLQLQFAMAPAPLREAFGLFGHGAIPELRQARISGTLAFDARLALPAGTLQFTPVISGFEVDGLGSERWLHAASGCGLPARQARLGPDSWLARAVVAAEDQRFFTHPGYDLVELAAALGAPAVGHADASGGGARGASTLTQQLAKLLVTGDERHAARKLRELLHAVEMERTLGKARILRLYLSHAPWGEGLCGAQAAARHYFGVRAHQLTPTQAVWLAAMLHNPGHEARQWQARGRIDLARAQRVALGISALSRRERLALAALLAGEPWAGPPPAPEPVPADPEGDGDGAR